MPNRPATNVAVRRRRTAARRSPPAVRCPWRTRRLALVAEQLTPRCPVGNAGARNRVEVREVGLDIEDQRAVDSVEATNADDVSLNRQQRHGRHKYRVEADLA